MKVDFGLRQFLVGVCLGLLTATGYAAEPALDLALPADTLYMQETKSFMLAANNAEALQSKANTNVQVAPVAEFEPKLFSGSKIHQYLGVGTAVLAGLAFATHIHPVGDVPREVNGTHGELGKAAAAMAVATVATGLYTHWDDFSLEDGWSDPDNLHVLLAATGAALMAYAVNKSATQSLGTVNHAALAELGALGMVIAIKLTW